MSRSLVDVSSVGTDSSENIHAIRRRLQKAFPEASTCFPRISQAIADGEPWATAVDTYALALSKTRLARLCQEIDDLFVMGWSESQFAVVVSEVFGLDAEVRTLTGDSAWRFVARVGDWLRAMSRSSPSTA